MKAVYTMAAHPFSTAHFQDLMGESLSASDVGRACHAEKRSAMTAAINRRS